MDTFKEYQALAIKVPLSLRNNRERLTFPVMGLQEQAGKIGRLMDASSWSDLTRAQRKELEERMADMLWCLALLCRETGLALHDVAQHSIERLQRRSENHDPDRR